MKSNLRLNDQLIPKPTDVNMGVRMIQVAIPKKHPYSSHISCFAVFPTFRSQDALHTGVRAASQASLNPLIPASALQVKVSSKTMGAPYRQEILDFRKTSRNKGVVSPGEHGLLDHTKPAGGQALYPTPPKTVLPNPKLCDWEASLAERTANMLLNMERSHWISSYQLQYTGSGPANPLKMDDFNEEIVGCSTRGVTSHNAPLRERSHPTFTPSKPMEGRMASRRRASLGPKTTSTPSTTGPIAIESEQLNRSRSLIPAVACRPNIDTTPSMYDSEPQEITATTVTPHVTALGRDQTEWISTKTRPALLSQELFHKQSERMPVSQPEHKEIQSESGKKETDTFMYDEIQTEGNMQGRTRVHVTQAENTDKVHSKVLWNRTLVSQEEPGFSNEETVNDVLKQSRKKYDYNLENHQHFQSQSVFGKKLVSDASKSHREWSRAQSAQQQHAPVSIQPRSQKPFNKQQVVHEKRPFSQRLPSLREQQESFSKSEACRGFNASTLLAPVNLRDSIHVGKKHKFLGINCYYFHG